MSSSYCLTKKICLVVIILYVRGFRSQIDLTKRLFGCYEIPTATADF